MEHGSEARNVGDREPIDARLASSSFGGLHAVCWEARMRIQHPNYSH